MGSGILRKTISISKKYGCNKFGAWTSSRRASRFYEKNGFVKGQGEKAIVINGKLIYKYPKGTILLYKKL